MTLSAVKFVAWTLLSDENSWFSKGVSHLTKVDEFAKLKASIDRGSPVTLGLIVARDLAHLGSNHQIIAYGYDETPDAQTVYIYDVNYPNRELALISANNALGWREDDDALKLHLEWRGWFIQDYKPKRPPANLDRLTITKRKAKTKAAVAAAKANAQALLVTLTSITFHNDDDKNATDDLALSFDIGGQTWRWPSGGTKTVEDGKRYRLNKSFSLSVFAGGSLNISARPAFSDAHQSAVNEGLLESNDAPLDNEPAGLIFNSFMVKDKWGIGEHSARSSGAGGAYTLVYSVSVA